MTPLRRLGLLAAFLVPLSGCLQTHEERVRVRRDQKVVDKEEKRIRPDAYEEFLRRRQVEQERLRLTPELNREFNHHKLTALRVEQSLASIAEDPFASYEKDRLDHLYRYWHDHDYPPPEPEKDVMLNAKKAEDPDEAEEEEATDEEAADEGDEDEEGWEDEEDWDDE
jgi:hypothetical protein